MSKWFQTHMGIQSEEKEDFIEKVVRLINEEKQEKAIKEIIDLDDVAAQIDILAQLMTQHIKQNPQYRQLAFDLSVARTLYHTSLHAHDFAHDLLLARDIALALTRDLLLAHDLAPDLAPDLALARDASHTLARDVGRALARDVGRALASDSALAVDRALAADLGVDRALAVDLALARAVDRAVDLARAVDLVRARDLNRNLARTVNLARTRDLARAIDIVHDRSDNLANNLRWLYEVISLVVSTLEGYITDDIKGNIKRGFQIKLADSLNEALYLTELEPSNLLKLVTTILWQLNEKHLQYITLEGITSITPHDILYEIGPMLYAIGELHAVHHEITGEGEAELRVVTIQNDIPKVETGLLGGLIYALNDVFSLRKRKDEEEMRKIQQQKARIENQQAEKQLQMTDIQMQKELLELSRQRMELEMDLQRRYLVMAQEYLKENYPKLSDEEILQHAPRVAQALLQGQSTNLALRLGWHDNPRPPRPDSIPK